MNVQQIAVERALKLLAASGAQYAVLMPDGTKVGNLEVMPPKGRTYRHRVNNLIGEFDYTKDVKALEVGGTFKWTAPDHAKAEALRSAVSSQGSKTHGNGSCMTVVNGCTVEILRVS